MERIYTRTLPVILCAIFGTGCVSFTSGLDVEDVDGNPASVRGIDQLHQDRQVRLLMIHGMGSERCPGYSVRRDIGGGAGKPGAVTRIAKRLGACLPEGQLDQLDRSCKEDDPDTYPKGIRLHTFDFAAAGPGEECRSDVIEADGVAPLRVYEIYYTGELEGRQKDLIDREQDVMAGHRTCVNCLIEESILINGFGDAVAYLGEFGPRVRDAVRATVCQMMLEAPGVSPSRYGPEELRTGAACPRSLRDGVADFADVDVYVISHSLGSNIVFRSLIGETTGPHALAGMTASQRLTAARAATAFRSALRGAYLLANQDALLQLAGPAEDTMATRIGASVRAMGGLPPDAEIVAFSDRNDILSFALAENACGEQESQCINATLHVARLGIPFVFVNPVTAHTKYEEDDTVIRCIAEGCP